MTTRAQLESERETLAYMADLVPADCESAVRASIARVEALLSLSDAQAHDVVTMVRGLLLDLPAGHARVDEGAVDLDALRTVADLIRREPRGDA